MRAAIVILVAIAAPANAQVSELEAGRAQGEMLRRIGTSISAYIKRIDIDPSYEGYCRAKMHLDTRNDADGFIPFGVNYHNIENSEQLKLIIDVRENFERSYLTLCLADAKRTLDAAEHR